MKKKGRKIGFLFRRERAEKEQKEIGLLVRRKRSQEPKEIEK